MKYHTSTTSSTAELTSMPPDVCLRYGPGRAKKLVHTNVRNNDFEFFLKLVAPYRHD